MLQSDTSVCLSIWRALQWAKFLTKPAVNCLGMIKRKKAWCSNVGLIQNNNKALEASQKSSCSVKTAPQKASLKALYCHLEEPHRALFSTYWYISQHYVWQFVHHNLRLANEEVKKVSWTLLNVIFNVVLCIVVSSMLLLLVLHGLLQWFDNLWRVEQGDHLFAWRFFLFTLCISITVTVLSQEFVVISGRYFCYLLYAFLRYLCIGFPGRRLVHHHNTTWLSVLYSAQLPVFSSLLAVNQIKSSMLRTFVSWSRCTVIVYTV